MKRIGVLALQGSVEEHVKTLSLIEGVEPVSVKSQKELDTVDGLIMPGGESTTIGKLLREFSIMTPLKERIESGMPTWGTCAGLILLAKKIVDDDIVHLGVLDADVRRNAFGSQLDSFETSMTIPEVHNGPIRMVFIRAPWVEKTAYNVNILAVYKSRIVALRQGNILGTSFHPELTGELYFHKYFVNMCN